MSTDVTLRARGLILRGWQEVQIKASVEDMCRTFSLKVRDVTLLTRDPPAAAVPLTGNTPCEVWIGNRRVIKGLVDKVTAAATATNLSFGISGRSETRDVPDCSAWAAGPRWSQKTVEEIAADIAQPHGGVHVVTGETTDTGGPVERFRLQRLEKAGAAIQRLAALRGLLVTDNEDGEIVLTRAGDAGVAEQTLALGRNVLESDGSYDVTGLYSDVICKGQFVSEESDAPGVSFHNEARFSDPDATRTRVLEIEPETRADAARCAERAQHEIGVRAGRASDTRVVVKGWEQYPDGPLWAPNLIVDYYDEIQGIHAELLLATVTYRLSSAEGERAILQVAPKSGYDLLAPVERKRAVRGVGPLAQVDAWAKELPPPVRAALQVAGLAVKRGGGAR